MMTERLNKRMKDRLQKVHPLNYICDGGGGGGIFNYVCGGGGGEGGYKDS